MTHPDPIIALCRTLVMRGKYAGAVKALENIEGLDPSEYDGILSGRTTISPDWSRVIPDDSGSDAVIAAAFRDVFPAMGQHYKPTLVVYPGASYNDYETEGDIRAVVRCNSASIREIAAEQTLKGRPVTMAASYAMEDDTLLALCCGLIFLCVPAPEPPPFLASASATGTRTVEQILSDAQGRLPAVGNAPAPRQAELVEETSARFVKTEGQIRDEVRARVGPEDGPGWITLRGKNALWRVPALPFHAWSIIQDSRYKALASGSMSMPAQVTTPDWEPVSPSGLRLSCDIPEHSDWLLGSRRLDLKTGQWRDGILDDYRDDDLLRAAVQRQETTRCGEVGYVVLAGGQAVTGTTLVDPPEDLEVCPPGTILVLETAGASWLQLSSTASAVIVEVGGALAHLISELRDASIPVLRVPGARAKFPTGTALSVDPATGLVQEV